MFLLDVHLILLQTKNLKIKYKMQLQDDESLTKEQIEAEIRKIKDANAEDEGTHFAYHLVLVFMIAI